MGRGAEQIKWPIHLEVNLQLKMFFFFPSEVDFNTYMLLS